MKALSMDLNARQGSLRKELLLVVAKSDFVNDPDREMWEWQRMQ
jgi:hypothetical protein